MPNVARFIQLPGEYPEVGYLQRVVLILTTAPDVATRARLIIVAKEFADSAAGGTELKVERHTHIYDSDADATPTLVVTAAGVPLDRIFDGDGVPYENLDDERTSQVPSGVPSGDGKKKRKLYAYLELNGTPTNTPSFRPIIYCKAAAMDLDNLRIVTPGSVS